MPTEERCQYCQNEIVRLIEKYGKEKFALSMVRYYGLRSLLDRGELKDIEELIKNV